MTRHRELEKEKFLAEHFNVCPLRVVTILSIGDYITTGQNLFMDNLDR
ncbi:hypothetical protein [Prochlorococcus marinus]|nr:hypothetical protein [Prochlorococcus marinus]